MRGNPRNQAKQIFRAINKIGTSRYDAKIEAMKQGAKGTQQIAKSTGVHSYNTLNVYCKITTEFLTWLREEYNIKDAAKTEPKHVERWLQEKIANDCKYKTFTTYAAALNKAAVGLSTIQKVDYNWTSTINEVREQAKTLSNEVQSRAYDNPEKLISELKGHYKLAASLQLYCGCRVREISKLTSKNIIGENQIKLTHTKGGRIRTVKVPSNLFNEVNKIVQEKGSFGSVQNSVSSSMSM